MEASVRTLKLTYEDYLYFPEDGRRHDLEIALAEIFE
jgi:hypothetical protein